MGASGWSYFTPWQKDVGAALRVLQRKERVQMGAEDEMAALLEAGEDGTHSILDIIGGISEKSYEERDGGEIALAFAVPQGWLMEAYGTTRPTRKMVEERGFDPAEQLERWTAVYFAVWDDEAATGEPQWWYFDGCSGD
jgi:hypothetical protein